MAVTTMYSHVSLIFHAPSVPIEICGNNGEHTSTPLLRSGGNGRVASIDVNLPTITIPLAGRISPTAREHDDYDVPPPEN